MNIGQRVRELREAKHMGQRELARLVGVAPSLISMIETGARSNPEYGTMKRIARALGVTLADLDPELTEQPESTDAPAVALAS